MRALNSPDDVGESSDRCGLGATPCSAGSDTPETDVACDKLYADGVAVIPLDDFARRLERERNARFTVKEIREYLEGWLFTNGTGRGLPLQSILAMLECDQDGIEACRNRRRQLSEPNDQGDSPPIGG